VVAGAGKQAQEGPSEWKEGFEGRAAVDAELSNPHFAMADAAGNIYIADKEAHAIRRVSPDGIITTVAGIRGATVAGDASDTPAIATEGALRSPNGLYVLPDGTFYVLDLGNDKVRKVTPKGLMSTLFRVPGGFGAGRGLYVREDESEAFVVSGAKVKRWTPDSGVQDFIGGLENPGNLAWDPKRGLLVTDRGAGKVYAVTGKGSLATMTLIAGSGAGGMATDCQDALAAPLPGVRAVWPAEGGYFVGLHAGSAVLFVDSAGFVHPFLDATTVGQVRSVSVDAKGNVIVVDHDAGFVRVVRRK
jgi:sugar lactone lactonase YvrE